VADEEPESQQAQIVMPQEHLGGVYANWARVAHSQHEFTIDFVRMEYASQPRQGVVVARVSVSPLFITQLIDALQQNWQSYAKRALPREIREETDE
jgi:Protein of unknown function (DUF3467)